ncbi:MAG: hypothetical protein ABR567_16670 [Myxococcales bacterium]
MSPAVFCAVAAVLIGAALQLSSGMYDARALALVTAATLLAVAAAFGDTRWGHSIGTLIRDTRKRVSPFILGAACAGGLVVHFFFNPTFYGDPRKLESFHWFAVVGLVLLSAYLCLHLRASFIRARFLLLLACFAMMGIAVLRASPRPWIDVWYLQQGAADALWHGYDPYSVSYPNIYGRMANVSYPPELLVNGRLFSFCYPPLTILVDLPARLLFGDIRYASLGLMIFSAWAIARLARGAEGELAALFILFQPRTFFVLEQSWIEPLVLAAIALTALLAARRFGAVALGIALGLLVASKQYSPYFALPLFLAFPPEKRLRSLLVAAGIAAAVLVPFAVWDWHGFWRGLVTWHFMLSSRDDALSLMALWNRHGGAPKAVVTLVPFLGVALLAGTLRWRVTVAQALAAAAAAYLLVVVAYKQAFCNYYWLSAGLLCAAVSALQAPGETA